MFGMYLRQQVVQLRQPPIVETVAVRNQGNETNRVERLLCLFILGDIFKVVLERFLVLHRLVKKRLLIAEEGFDILHLFFQIADCVLLFDYVVNERHIILDVREKLLHRIYCRRNQEFFGVFAPRIEGEEVFISRLFPLEADCDVADQAILVLGHVHFIEVIAQELSDFADFGERYRLALGDDGAADLTLFMKHLREFRVIWLDGTAATFHGDLLRVNELRHYAGDVQFPPAVGNPLIAALDILHRGAQFFGVLYLQIFLHLDSGLAVRFRAEEGLLRTAQDGGNIRLAVRIFTNQRKVAVDMVDEILQRLIDHPLGIAAFQQQMFSVHIKLRRFYGFDKFSFCFQLVLSRLFLMASDDGPHRLRKLRHVFLHDVLLHLHGVFKRRIVGCVGENDQSLPDGFGGKTQVCFFDGVCGYREDFEFHAARRCAHGGRVHHPVKGKIIFVAIAIFLGCINIAKNHAADFGHDGGGIHDGIAVNVALNILLLVGQEAIDFPCATDVVLCEEALKGRAHSLPHADFIETDLIRHKDHKIVEGRFHIVHIAHEIEEFQHSHILHFQAMSCLGCPFRPLDDLANGTVQEGMHCVIEEMERRKGILVLVFDFLRRLLKAREHGAFAAREMFAGIAVLADFGTDLLHEDELIGHEREIPGKFGGAVVAANIFHRLREAEEVFQHGVVLRIERFQLLLGVRRFLQDTLLDHLVRRG